MNQPSPNNSQESKIVKVQAKARRLDLICGILVGGIVVASMDAVLTKWNMKHPGKHSLSAKPLVDHTKIGSRTMPRKDALLEAAPKPAAPETAVTTAAPAPAAPPTPTPIPTPAQVAAAMPPAVVVKKESKILDRVAKTGKVSKTTKYSGAKVEKNKVATAAARKSTRPGELIEMKDAPNAIDVQNAAEQTLVAPKIASNSQDASLITSGAFVTISTATYSKANLTNCPQRCLVPIKTAKGEKMNAVISGPNFADALSSHQGTINLTGKKVLIQNHELFMVQGVTFNVSKPLTAVKSPYEARKDLSEPTFNEKDGFEDLNEDLK